MLAMDFVRTQISSVMSCMQKHPRIAALTAAGAAVSLVGFAALSGVFQKKWEVHDKVVLITGASSGMGKELALQLVGMGARYVENFVVLIFLGFHILIRAFLVY